MFKWFFVCPVNTYENARFSIIHLGLELIQFIDLMDISEMILQKRNSERGYSFYKIFLSGSVYVL